MNVKKYVMFGITLSWVRFHPTVFVTNRSTGEREVTSFILIFRYNKWVYLKHITQKAILSVLLQGQDLLHLVKC